MTPGVRPLFALTMAAGLAACGVRAEAPPTGFFANADVRLNYTFTRPAGKGPFPGVVIGHGSGRVGKAQCAPLSTNLVRRGYATLCYDKRGVGRSTGKYADVGTKNSQHVLTLLASDMVAAVRFLAVHPDVDRRRIGLAGGSQAGWIIPIAAAMATPRPAFMIIFSGPTVSVGEEIHFSKFAEGTSTPVDDAYARLLTFTGSRGFDPLPTLRALDVPGLWILGLDDRSIPIRDTIRLLDQLIDEGKPYAHVDFPGVPHSLVGADIWPAVDAFLNAR